MIKFLFKKFSKDTKIHNAFVVTAMGFESQTA